MNGSADSSGGLIGWNTQCSRVTNSLQVAAITLETKYSCTIGRNPVNMLVMNTYYKTQFGDAQGTLAMDEGNGKRKSF